MTSVLQWGRVAAAGAVSLAVLGCAVVVTQMGRHDSRPTAHATRSTPGPTSRPAIPTTAGAAMPVAVASAVPAVPGRHTAASTSASSTPNRTRAVSSPASATPPATPPASSSIPASARPVRPAARVSHPSAASRPRSAPRPAPPTTAHPAPQPAAPLPRGTSLPLRATTSDATKVITVVASSYGSTTARLQAWTKAAGGGWLRYGPSILANVGSAGLTTSPSESKSATPIGSFTLTRAFGYYSDPGTALPYLHTNLSDWWISQSGPLYNTLQVCASGCPFDTSGNSPNEHLATETPYYNYAVAIDYNTRNAPGGVRAGAGSAFFLHVEHDGATAGCVSIPQTNLVTIMRWLSPSAHPRILIGVS